MAQPLLARIARAGQLRQLSTTVARAAEQQQVRTPRTPRPEGLRERRGPAVPAQGLPELLETLGKLKETGRTPTPAAYLALMRAAADYGIRRGNNKLQEAEGEAPDPSVRTLGFEIALGAMRDAKAGGIELGNDALDVLFRFVLIHPDILPSLLVEMSKTGVTSSVAGNTLANGAITTRSVEELLVIVVEMLEQKHFPNANVVKHLIRLLCEWAQPRLALQIAQRLEETPGTPKVEVASWINILQASAESQYLEGVEIAWDRVVSSKAYAPDEGLILAVLAVAGRWGRTGLASQALELLPSLGIEPQEHHMAPLLEAFCNEGRVPDALKVVTSLREAGINPTLSTVRPIVNVLSNTEIVDQAFYALEDMHAAGEVVDVAALNAVIEASSRLGDLQRARATQLAAGDLGVTPTIETFNIVLEACARAKHRQLGDTILKEIAAAELEPDQATYEGMVAVCVTQPDYEDAFHYLEKMKAEGFVPSREVYSKIGLKCAQEQDGRWKLVSEEMGQIGYKARDFGYEVEKGRKRGRPGPREGGGEGGGEGRDGRQGERRERRGPRRE
ncbi:hypothetical protein Q8F55_000857 [Vanrija albida]|uniref:Pentatricopeptide repeat-containing protein-mitochondrial domain-containing protein n=1 Tax=Vanrija albida TaxID=181172 RepID=A0ABR3QEG1_9TREE